MAKEKEQKDEPEEESWGTKAKNLLTAGNARINNVTLILMLAVSIIFIDGPQIFIEWTGVGLLFSWIPSILGGLIFYFWFKLKGVNFVSPKKALTYAGSLLIDIIPGSDALLVTSFNWAIAIIILVAISRVEDIAGIKLNPKTALQPGNLQIGAKQAIQNKIRPKIG
jgi:hypothetical protein